MDAKWFQKQWGFIVTLKLAATEHSSWNDY
jgi:hypothetical protein